MNVMLPLFWVGIALPLVANTPEVEIVDNDGEFIVDNDGAQLIDN